MSLESRHSELLGGRESPEARLRTGSLAKSNQFVEFDHSWDFRLGFKGTDVNPIEDKDEGSGLKAKLGKGQHLIMHYYILQYSNSSQAAAPRSPRVAWRWTERRPS